MALDRGTAQTWASSMLGIDYELKRTANLQLALATPGAYYTKRVEALTQIGSDIDTEFVKKFEELKKQGLPKADAQRRAESWAASLYKLRLEELDFELPASIQQLAANLQFKAGAARMGIDLGATRGSGGGRSKRK